MSTYQKIIYPIRRIDGLIVTGSDAPLPADPEVIGLTVSGEDVEINGVAYKLPTAPATADTTFTTDGAGNITWEPVPGLGFLSKIQDLDANTSINVDILGTGADDTIRFTSNGDEVMTITEETTTIKNSIDVSNKFTYDTINTIPGVGNQFTIFRNNYLYIPMASGNLHIYDVTNINNIVSVSTTALGISDLYHAKFYGDYLFISSNAAVDIRVIDVSDPTSPFIANTIPCQRIRRFVISGSYLYALCNAGPDTLEIYDISDPLNESLISSTTLVTNEFELTSMIIKDNTLYSAFISSPGFIEYLKSFDISDPSNPVLLDTLILDNTGVNIRFEGSEIIGNYLFLCKSQHLAGSTSCGIISVNITNPSALSIANTNYPYNVQLCAIENYMIVKGKYAYIISNDSSTAPLIHIFNIADPTNIVVAAINIVGPPGSNHINFYKDYIVVASLTDDTYFLKFNSSYDQMIEAGSTTTNYLEASGDVKVSNDVVIEDSLQSRGGIIVSGDVSINDKFQVTGTLISDGSITNPSRTTGEIAINLDDEYLINAVNSSAAVYTLPPITTLTTGQTVIISKETITDVRLATSGTDTIWDGLSNVSSTLLLSTNPNEVYEYLCTGARWLIINNLDPLPDLSVWIVVGNDQVVSTDNGETWTFTPDTYGLQLGLAYNGTNRWVSNSQSASAPTNIAYSSNDGASWSYANGFPNFDNWTYKPAYSAVHNRWVIGGRLNVFVGYSNNNGVSWTNQRPYVVGNSEYFDPEFNGTDLFMIGCLNTGTDNGRSLLSSPDGITWTSSTSIPLALVRCMTVIYHKKFGRWMAAGQGGAVIYYSDDAGATWTGTETNIGPLMSRVQAMDHDNGSTWVAGGFGTNSLIYSTDNGVTWTGLGLTIFSSQCRSIQHNGYNRWMAAGQGTNTVARSDDGINWTGLGLLLPSFGASVGSKRLRNI